MSIPLKISEQYNLLSGEKLKLFEERLLEQYLNGKMNLDEKGWFENILLDKYIETEWDKNQILEIEKLLDQNQNLKTKYQSWVETAIILNQQSESDRIKNLIFEQLKEEKTNLKYGGKIINLNKRNLQYLLLAATVIILIGVGVTMWINRPYSTDKLYAMYYEPYKLDFEITRNSLASSEFIIKAQEAFLNGETENTIHFLDQAIIEDPNNYQLYLNLGSIYMVTEQFTKAISIYKKVPPEADYHYETARWFMGLCYIKTKEKDKAVKVFRKLEKNGKYYKEETIDLLNNMN